MQIEFGVFFSVQELRTERITPLVRRLYTTRSLYETSESSGHIFARLQPIVRIPRVTIRL